MFGNAIISCEPNNKFAIDPDKINSASSDSFD